jgi:hypothetical protein
VLNADDASYYQTQIGVLRWIAKIGQIDIILGLSLLTSQLAPRHEGHMAQIFGCSAYLKIRHNGCLIFNPSYCPDEWL